MPCFSRLITKLNNSDTLAAALVALGWRVSKDAFNVYAEKGNESLSFTRYDRQSAFNVSGDTEHLSAIGSKIARSISEEIKRSGIDPIGEALKKMEPKEKARWN